MSIASQPSIIWSFKLSCLWSSPPSLPHHHTVLSLSLISYFFFVHEHPSHHLYRYPSHWSSSFVTNLFIMETPTKGIKWDAEAERDLFGACLVVLGEPKGKTLSMAHELLIESRGVSYTLKAAKHRMSDWPTLKFIYRQEAPEWRVSVPDAFYLILHALLLGTILLMSTTASTFRS